MAQVILLCTALLYLFGKLECSDETESLRMVSVLFRHGEKTRDAYAYPKDPYINQKFEPYGIGELTKKGKITDYHLGEMLRKRYDRFLGPIFQVKDVNAASADDSKTKTSLQLVLAGLYPPENSLLAWNQHLNWNPIAYDILQPKKNHVLSIPMVYCPRYKAELAEYLKSPKAKRVGDLYAHQYEYLSNNTGLSVKSIVDLYFLYETLSAEDNWGLVLPEWTKSVYPEYLKNATVDNLVLWHDTPTLKQLSGGFLLKKITSDMIAATKKSQPKIFLYSAHDVTVASLLNAMDVYFPHIPPFGAYVVVELHSEKGNDFVKVFYQDYTSGEDLKNLVVPKCTANCPLRDFIHLLDANIPSEGVDPCEMKS